MRTKTTSFAWEMCYVLSGSVGHCIYHIIRISNDWKLFIFRTNFLRPHSIHTTFFIFINVSLVKRDQFRIVAKFSVRFFLNFTIIFLNGEWKNCQNIFVADRPTVSKNWVKMSDFIGICCMGMVFRVYCHLLCF